MLPSNLPSGSGEPDGIKEIACNSGGVEILSCSRPCSVPVSRLSNNSSTEKVLILSNMQNYIQTQIHKCKFIGS